MVTIDEVRRRVPSPLVMDAALAVALSILAVIESLSAAWRPFNPAVILMMAPLAWRRRQPLLVFLLIVAVAVIAFVNAPYTGIAAVMVAAYSVGAYSRYRLPSLGAILLTVTIIVVFLHGVLPPLPDWAGPFAITVSLWLAGNAIRARQQRADAFENKAMRLELEREQAMRAAVAEERSRIARELHDVVAHNVSVMLVQAGAARRVLTTSPGNAREALLAVESSGREAMAELRQLLGILNDDGEGVALAPQPGVEALAPLLRRVGEAGLPVELRIEGAPRSLAPSIDLTAYRIVQEALTNALKYAGLARTQVILDYRERDLKIEVLDDGPGACPAADGAGRGLAGMRERVALYGGTLEAGPRLERGYAVRAWLPLDGAP